MHWLRSGGELTISGKHVFGKMTPAVYNQIYSSGAGAHVDSTLSGFKSWIDSSLEGWARSGSVSLPSPRIIGYTSVDDWGQSQPIYEQMPGIFGVYRSGPYVAGNYDLAPAKLTAGGAITGTAQSISNLNTGGSTGSSAVYNAQSTQIDRVASVTANADGAQVSLSAQRDINLNAAKVDNAGADSQTTIVAGNNLNLNTVQISQAEQHNLERTQIQKAGTEDVGSTISGGGSLVLQAGNTLTLKAAQVKAAQDVTLNAGELMVGTGIATQQSEQTTQENTRNFRAQTQSAQTLGSVVQAGNNLTLETKGDATVVGSALAAGNKVNISIGKNLNLLAGRSTSQTQVQDWQLDKGAHEIRSLAYSDNEVRQILSTITAGDSANVSVGGNFAVQTGSLNAQGQQEADRMTAGGVVAGATRQQVSVSGSAAGTSQVKGNLAAQGIRAGANDSFDPLAAQTGQAAVAQFLNSGLLQIGQNAKLTGQLNSVLNSANGPVTTQDATGKISLTVAGQATVQQVFNTLKLSETFSVEKFPDAGTAQIVTLAVAIALTVCTGGAAAGTLGAAAAGAGTASAAAINAAIIASSSTLAGQLAGGQSFDKAFEMSLKAGVAAAVTAGTAGTYQNALSAQSIGAQTLAGCAAGQISGAGCEQGAGMALVTSTAGAAYKSWVGYDANALPGKNPASSDTYPFYKPTASGQQPFGSWGNNVIGLNDPANPNGFWAQGGAASRALNQVPFVNATAGLHDYIFNVPNGPDMNAFTNVGTMLPAATLAIPASLNDPLLNWLLYNKPITDKKEGKK